MPDIIRSPDRLALVTQVSDRLCTGSIQLPIGSSSVPRFFLHIRSGEELIEDPDVSELRDLDEARAEAIAGARDLLAEQLRLGKPLDGQRIEIYDEAGQLLATIPFREVFTLP